VKRRRSVAGATAVLGGVVGVARQMGGTRPGVGEPAVTGTLMVRGSWDALLPRMAYAL
jgi:hypothetical protein